MTLLNNIFAQNGGNDQPDTTSTSAYFVDLGATTVLTQGYSLYDNNAGNLPSQTSDLTADPLFLDAVYHLSDFSPAIDSGTLSGTLGVADADIDGEPRLMGIGIDIGADELLQVPDFVFEPPLQTALIEEGEVYTYTYTLTNTGDLVDSYTISRTSNTTGGTGWGYAFYPATIDDLIVGDSVTVTLVVTGGEPGYVDTTNLTAVSAIDPTLTRVVTAVTTINQVAGVLIAPDRSGSGEPGEVITYSHTLTNTGNGPDTFSLMVASQLPAGWLVTIDPATTGVITPNGSIPVTVSVTVPVDGWAGVVHTAVIEAASVFSPTVTDSVTDTTTILPIYGLLIDPSAATYNSPEGAVAVYTHTLTNTGNVTDTVDIEVANGNGLTWTVEALTTPVELEPFGSAVISVSVDVPLGSTGLTHVMLVTATSTLSPSVQATAVNTTTVATVSGVILQPDRSGNAGAGQTAVYAHTLTNNGNASDSFNLTSNSSQGWTVNIDPTNTGALAAGQTIPVTVTVSVPGGTAVGTIDVSTITATSANDPAVTDTVTDTTTVVDVPERSVVIAPDNSLATLAGQTIFYYHTITNTGTASDSYALTFDSSEGWTVTVNPSVANLAAGQSTQLEVTVVVPGGVPTNTVDTLVITATSGFDTAVFDTATNTTTVTDTIVAELSLVPNNVDSGAPGTLVTYLHTLTNLGNSTDTITLQANSANLGWVASAVPLQVTLNPGEQAAVTVTVSIPASATNGQVETTLTRADSSRDADVMAIAQDRTTVVVDPGTFNGAYLPLIMRAPADTTPPTPTPTPTVTGTPPATFTPTPTATPVTHIPVCIQPTYGSPAGVDLVVTAVEAFPNNPVTGQQVVIRVTIRNQGSTSVSVGNNFYLDAYFNRLPAFAIAGDLAWGIQGADLAAGATRSYEAIYTFGAPGQYWMYGQVDTDNTVAEVNEANNQLGGCAAHVVTVTGTALNPDGGTPTSVPSSAGQPRQTPTPNVLATPTAEPTALPTETAVPTETATATPTPFPAPSETPTPDGSDGSEEEGKATATPEPTVTPSPTVLGKPEE